MTRPSCPFCKSNEIVFKGFNESKSHKRCLCKTCKKYFKIGIFNLFDKKPEENNLSTLNISNIENLDKIEKPISNIHNVSEITFLYDEINKKVIEINQSFETVSAIISQKLVQIDDPDEKGRIVYKVSNDFDKKLATKS